MADEQDEALKEGGEELNAPEEQEELLLTDEVQPDPVAELATSMGWMPKEQYKGDPANWKPADQFIRDGQDIMRQQSRDLKELRSTVDTISKTSAVILEEKIAEAREKLKTEYAAAVEEGDPNKAWEIGEKLNGLASKVPASTDASPTTKAWVERNSWFTKDPLAQQRAIEVADIYAKRGASISEQLEAAENAIKRERPDLFPTAGKPPPGVAAPGSRNASQSAKAKTAADMPKEAQKIAKDMVERGVIPTVDHYARNYWATEGKSQ